MEGILIQQVIFGERVVEISYTEPRDQSADGTVMMVRSIAIDMSVIEEDIADVIDSLTQIVDAGLLRVRSPEEKRIARRPSA